MLKRSSSIKVKLNFSDGFPSPEFQCILNSNRFEFEFNWIELNWIEHFKPWLGKKEKSCLLSMFLPWLQSSFWWFFAFSAVFPQNVKNTVLKTPAEFFSLLSHFFPPPLSVSSCAGHFCRAADRVGDSYPVITCTAEVHSKIYFIFASRNILSICAWNSDLLSGPSVLWNFLDPAVQECCGLNPAWSSTPHSCSLLIPTGCRENKWEGKSERTHRLI